MERKGIPEYDLTERRVGNITTEIMTFITKSFPETDKVTPFVRRASYEDLKVTKGLRYSLGAEQIDLIRPQLALLGYAHAVSVELEVEFNEENINNITSAVRIEDDQVRATFGLHHNDKTREYEVHHRVYAQDEMDKPPLILSEEKFDPERAIELLAIMRGMIEANKAGAESVSYDELGYIDDLVRALQ